MLKVGIVGLPNVGKSTLFNAVLKKEQALSANYPFATIEPNVGVVEVPDKRLDKLAELIQKETGINPPKVYAAIEFVDIAGLIAGASKGEGLGNQFLANIREVDMILQVVRDFSDPDIIREHSKNPDIDTDVINSELIIKDLESLEKRIKSVGRKPSNLKEPEILNKYFEHLNNGGLAIDLRETLDPKDYKEIIKPLFLLTDKPIIYVFNISETDERLKNPYNEQDQYKNKPVVFISAKIESELSTLSPEDQKVFMGDLGISESGLDKIAQVCFNKIGLISYLTAGEKEVRAWEVLAGSNAAVSAGRIHTDFEKNFIKAEVIAYNDYIECETRQKARDKGKLRLEGKEYIVKDGDVIEFRIGATK
jgi:GTP-binding protein YchF